MFVGHLAVAFVGRRARPELSLGWFVAAATLLDLIWPVLLLLGIERVSIVPHAMAFTPLVFEWYPWSHSLLMALGWGIALAFVARWRGVSSGTALVLALLVVSHWVLDVVTHAPDLPLWPGNSPRFGLGLWNSIAGTLIVEGTIWIAALALYLTGNRARDRVGPFALGSLGVISTGLWAMGPWSPPPPDPGALGWFALIGWVVVPWAAWADRHYAPRGGA
jgi:membrane-bound metal-dependent hydrolase YbcI (DUF457 family)